MGFLPVLVLIAGLVAGVVAFGTHLDGSGTLVSTAADQQSLMAGQGARWSHDRELASIYGPSTG
jgi:hypothetical protein